MANRIADAERRAFDAAEFLRKKLQLTKGPVHLGIVLGTGFGDKLILENRREVPFSQVPGFSELQDLAGHERKFIAGTIEGVLVVGLSGRIHLNEDFEDNAGIMRMVRLQTQVLMELGVRKLIVTCAAGSLPGKSYKFGQRTRIYVPWWGDVKVGSLVVIDGFVTNHAPALPSYAGEFVSPADTLSVRLKAKALEAAFYYPGEVTCGAYAMLRGSAFETQAYDKPALAKEGARIVGMSVYADCFVASLYGAEVLALAFVTNDCIAKHSHEGNLAVAKQASEGLGNYLSHLIQAL